MPTIKIIKGLFSCSGDLVGFMKVYRKKYGRRPPNLSDFAVHDVPAGAGRKGGKLPKKKTRPKVAAEENRIPLQVNCGQRWSSTQVSSPGPDSEGCPDYVRMNQTVDNCHSPMGGLTDCSYAYGSSQCHFTVPA